MLKSISILSISILSMLGSSLLAQDTLTVSMADQQVGSETQISIPISVTAFDSISYFSLSINWDSTRFSFNTLNYQEGSGLVEGEYGSNLVDAASLGMQWVNGQALTSSVEDDMTILILVLDIISDNRDTIQINITSNPTSIEAGDVNGNEIPLNVVGANISFDQQSTSLIDLETINGFHVDQNKPNPFSDETEIWFELSNSEEVRFEVFDIDGRRVTNRKAIFPKGKNNIKLNKLQLTGSGVYQYSLTVKQKTITKKLILLDQ